MTATQEILSRQHLQQLDEVGYAVIKGFLDTRLTARLRAHIDSLCPAPGTTPRERHDLRHPVPGEVMAEALYQTPIIPLAAELLGSSPHDLRLLEQVLCRSDPSADRTNPGATGWHVDVAFPPEEYHCSPRRTYYHHIHALSTVEPGGGAFTIVPGSHHTTYAAVARVGPEALKADPLGASGVDISRAIEVCPHDGDLLIFNPMSMHSASKNIQTAPRYVYFASFFDASARYLRNYLTKTNYWRQYPEALHQNLPAALPRLLSWEA